MNGGAVQHAGILVLFPVVSTVAGAVLAVLRPPSPRATSAIQHFAAGVVLAAVAGEVLPDLRERGGYGITALGFAAGVGLMLLMQRFEPAAESQSREGGRAVFPLGLVLVVGIDLLVDGLLVGVGVSLGQGAGLILTVALTLEVLFLGLAVTVQLTQAGVGRLRAAGITSALSLGVALGAVAGAVLLDGASDSGAGGRPGLRGGGTPVAGRRRAPGRSARGQGDPTPHHDVLRRLHRPLRAGDPHLTRHAALVPAFLHAGRRQGRPPSPCRR